MRIGFLLSQPMGQSLGTDSRIAGLVEGLESLGIDAMVFVPGRTDRNSETNHISVGAYGLSGPERLQGALRNLLSAPVLGNLLFRNTALLREQARALSDEIVRLAPDIHLIQGEQQLASLAVIRAARDLGIPAVADIHGIWSEELVALGSVRRGARAFEQVRALEAEILAGADLTLVVSAEMKEFLVSEFGADPGTVAVVPNTAHPRVPSVPVRAAPRRAVFAGMLTHLQNVRLLVDGMAIAAKEVPDIEFHLTERGEAYGQVKKACARRRLPARFFWHETHEDLFRFLASCDVGLLTARTDLDNRVGYPSKLFDYMSVGLPIVANRAGSWSDIIERDGLGVVTDSTPAGFAAGIVELVRDPCRIGECGARGLELLRTKYAQGPATEKLAQLYGDLRGNGSAFAPILRVKGDGGRIRE